MKHSFLLTLCTVGVLMTPSATFAQAAEQRVGQGPPAAVGEEGKKPTRGFASALAHNLGDDVKHLPRRNSLYWLAGGSALALGVHHWDNSINAHLVNNTTDRLWTPGHIVGSTPAILGAAGAAYVFGRATGRTRLQHLGMDEIEAAILAEGITQGTKLAVRRDRPAQTDGQQSQTYSFPSGHSMLTFAGATVLQQHLGYKAAIPTYLIASYVAMSRLHDNRHYASDVMFGATMGVVVGRSVTFHGRNFYASPMLLPDGGGIQLALRH
jgi:membrane-associated phospholipid phosphatase